MPTRAPAKGPATTKRPAVAAPKKKPAAPKKKPAAPKKTATAKTAARQRVKVDSLRTLGGERKRRAPARPAASKAMQVRAREVLEQEFERIMTMQQKLNAETKIGGTEKGRSSPRHEEKLRSLVASLEGMSRFALQMGLLTPAESRELYALAMKRGLYAGWR